MKYSLVLTALLSASSLFAFNWGTNTDEDDCKKKECSKSSISSTEKAVLASQHPMVISVLGQGVAPVNTTSPAQAYALAKRAATADAYRLIAEKVKGVRVEGQDTIQNMMVKRSSIRTHVAAVVRNASLVETTFKEGLCEVEMEITLYHSNFAR